MTRKTISIPICLGLLGSSASASLLLTEAVVTPTGAEFFEIYNPTGAPVALDNIYAADHSTYYGITTGSSTPAASDFRVRFPAGSSIPAGGVLTVSLESATDFQTAYGSFPDFDFSVADLNAPAMLGTFGGSSGLTNSGEMLVLFMWDGSSELVSDLDYLLYGSTTSAMDKTAVAVGSSTYANEIAPALQNFAGVPGSGFSLQRIDFTEGTEIQFGGNGLTGADETSENLATTWAVLAATPGAVAAIPEPARALLIAFSLVTTCLRRRRR